MYFIKRIFPTLIIISILSSCTASRDVVSNSLFQKRKYNKGWHFNGVKKDAKRKSIDAKQDVLYDQRSGYAKTEKRILNEPCDSDLSDPKVNQVAQKSIIIVKKTKQTAKLVYSEVVSFGNKITTISKVLKPASYGEFQPRIRKVEGWSLASFVMIMIGVLLTVLLATVLWYAPLGAILLSILGVIISVVLSFVFGIMGLSKFSYSKHYSISLFFALFGLTVSAIVITVAILSSFL